MKKRYLIAGLGVCLVAITNPGCSKEEKIRSYLMENERLSGIMQEAIGNTQDNGEDETPVWSEPENPFENLMVLDDVGKVKEFLLSNMEHGNLQVEFIYQGQDMPDISDINRLLCIPYGSIEYTIDESGWKRIQMTEYPGTRMVRAYRTGDRSELTEEENMALDQAMEIVKEAQEKAETPLMLELFLHDWLCEHIDYDETTTEFSDPSSIPHHLTAVGALLDGRANCQGYTDGFYVLGNLAGFHVERMSCVNIQNGENHIMNVIELNDQWSVVDVTYDDGCGEAAQGKIYNYRMFNAGKDIVKQENNWEEIFENYPIAEQTTSDYFYYTEESNRYPCFGKAFTTIKEMAENVAEQYVNGQQMKFYMMLQGRKSDWSVLQDSLIKELGARGKNGSIYVTYVVAGEHTYYEICING